MFFPSVSEHNRAVMQGNAEGGDIVIARGLSVGHTKLVDEAKARDVRAPLRNLKKYH